MDAGHRGLPLEPGPGTGPNSERLVAVPVPMGLGWAQPEDKMWVPLSTGSPPVGGAKGVGCNAEGGDLGDLILGY